MRDNKYLDEDEQQVVDQINATLIAIVMNFYDDNRNATFTKLSKAAARAEFNRHFGSKAEASNSLAYLRMIRDELFQNKDFHIVYKLDFFFNCIGMEREYIN